MNSKLRSQLFFWARILVAVAFVVVIVLKFDLARAAEKIVYANHVYVGLAVGAFLIFVGFLALRWLILSKARNHPYGFFYLYRSLISHFFFNNILPSTIGGDVYRVVDTGGHEGKGVAFSVVWTDRMTGFIGVFGFGFLASIIYTMISKDFLLLAIFGGVFVFSIALTLAFISKKINGWLFPKLSKFKIFKYPIGEKIAGAFSAITHYRRHKGALVSAVFTSLGVQVSLVAVWYLLFLGVIYGRPTPSDVRKSIVIQTVETVEKTTISRCCSLGLTNTASPKDTEDDSEPTKPPNFVHFMVTIPIVNTAAMFSVGGWGVREVAFVNILGTFSVKASADDFLANTLLFDIVNVFYGLIGGLFILFRRGKKHKENLD